MGRIWMPGGGSGKGAKLEAVTAGAYDVREGAVIVDKNGNSVTGLVPTKNKWTATLPINGQVTIPWGIHDGNGLVTQNIPTQAAMTLNPGTTQKTAYVYQKYMLGNITVPAISIPAAYIKKGQRITFPDGSSVVGTFEGWVPVATDLYYNGQNVAGFAPGNASTQNGASFDNNQITIKSTIAMILQSTKTYDVRSYSKFIIEGNLICNSGGTNITVKPNNGQGNVSVRLSGTQSQITIDIATLTSLASGWTLSLGEAGGTNIAKDSYIRRIRLA